jgi:hypothetical protein
LLGNGVLPLSASAPPDGYETVTGRVDSWIRWGGVRLTLVAVWRGAGEVAAGAGGRRGGRRGGAKARVRWCLAVLRAASQSKRQGFRRAAASRAGQRRAEQAAGRGPASGGPGGRRASKAGNSQVRPGAAKQSRGRQNKRPGWGWPQGVGAGSGNRNAKAGAARRISRRAARRARAGGAVPGPRSGQ